MLPSTVCKGQQFVRRADSIAPQSSARTCAGSSARALSHLLQEKKSENSGDTWAAINVASDGHGEVKKQVRNAFEVRSAVHSPHSLYAYSL